MVWELSPLLGIGIPTLLISSIGYGGHLFIFHKYWTSSQQIWFQFCLTMLWISYVSAILKDPGTPPNDFKPSSKQWRKWCRKCQKYKPERTHHCKTCKKCVKQMDHHCSWIANCVGHDNMPQFLRFLVWVDYTNGYAFVELCKRILTLWRDRNLPIYMISKVELVVAIVLTPLSFLVLLTVGLMTFRWLYSISFRGMTQIESWEYERIESQLSSHRFLQKVKNNYELFNSKELLVISSWSAANRKINVENNNSDYYDNNEDTSPFDSDDIIFPYDINPWRNLINSWGYPYSWLLPWGKPLGDGCIFPKNDYATGDDQDLSSIPWPPDGNHDERSEVEQQHENVNNEKSLLKRRKLDRKEWYNDYGEKLSDFGVEID